MILGLCVSHCRSVGPRFLSSRMSFPPVAAPFLLPSLSCAGSHVDLHPVGARWVDSLKPILLAKAQILHRNMRPDVRASRLGGRRIGGTRQNAESGRSTATGATRDSAWWGGRVGWTSGRGGSVIETCGSIFPTRCSKSGLRGPLSEPPRSQRVSDAAAQAILVFRR